MTITDHDIDAAPAPAPAPSFTCDTCGTKGSLRWMGAHPCATIAQTAEQGGRCEDYPCCGHTDGDGCAPLESHTKDYWTDVFAARERAGYDFDDPIFDNLD